MILKRMPFYIAAAVTFMVISAGAGGDRPPVGFEALSGVDHLWKWSGHVQTAMMASTDPTGGNMDMSQFHGEYKGEKILAKIDGPGCIYRIWSAYPSGSLKVYLDGSERPEIECGFKDYLEAKCKGLPTGFSVGRTANYMPIPFEKSILITTERFHFPGYYQVSYQTYNSDIKVTSFRKDDALNDPNLPAAVKVWSEQTHEMAGLAYSEGLIEVKPSAESVALDIKGTGVIRKLSVVNPENPGDALEGVRLKIFWDGVGEAAVNVPLDAFFINRFDLKSKWPGGSLKTLFIDAGASGYSSYLPMPFAGGANVAIVGGKASQRLKVTAEYETLDSLPSGAMRLHAFYTARDYETAVTSANTITAKTPIDPSTNYVALDIKGKGNYIGCALFVTSVGTLWWGEGDEMTYIDGAADPQIRGTGTEDEFNWSWGFQPNMSLISGTLPIPAECKEPYAAQLIPPLRNPDCLKKTGENIAYRFRLSDYVPFERSIKVTYEILGASWLAPHSPIAMNFTQQRGDDWASIAYWYQMP